MERVSYTISSSRYLLRSKRGGVLLEIAAVMAVTVVAVAIPMMRYLKTYEADALTTDALRALNQVSQRDVPIIGFNQGGLLKELDVTIGDDLLLALVSSAAAIAETENAVWCARLIVRDLNGLIDEPQPNYNSRSADPTTCNEARPPEMDVVFNNSLPTLTESEEFAVLLTNEEVDKSVLLRAQVVANN